MKIYNSEKSIKEQFETLTLISVFEIEVINKKNKDIEYIIFDISIDNNKFKAKHIALNTEQENSNKIAFCESYINSFFTLDENLENLHDECIQSIMDSEFFELN